MRMRMFTALMIKWVLHRLMTSANECRKEWTRELALMIKPLLASLRSISIRMLTAMICQNSITYKKITLQNW